MIRYLLITSFFCLGLFPALQAQGEDLPARGEAIDAFRIAFFTKRLSLTAEEAQRFWPEYHAYTDELESLRAESRAKQQQMRDLYFANGSEAEIERLSDDFIGLKRREYEIAERYHARFKQVLPIRKVVMLYKAEQDFKRELLQELQRRRQQQGGRPIRPGIRNR
ncbi:MAG: hypothetical protein D6722_26420 [Bacteroidetes bacterium]|nr:MAG: hypothetical protein D6722_26420 [Bacteroidota bacterium]